MRAAVQTQQNKELLVGQKMEDRLAKAAAFVRERLGMTPQVGVVLGSGLGDFAALVEADCILPYADIPGFPTTTVEGHAGRFVFGRLDGVPVAVMQGRVHYYEGYDMADVVMPIRLMRLLGVKSVVLTNASGGINPALKPGTFMLVTDHLFFLVPSPLRGANLDSLGLRFPDMSQVYDSDLLDLARKSAAAEGVELHEGVYIQTAGPNFETPAEIRMYGRLGADAVGMSTACEAMAARHCGLRVCALSCIANLAAGISPTPLSIEEVYEVSARQAPVFQRLLRRLIREIGM